MSRRITRAILQRLVDRINIATGNPTLTVQQPENGGPVFWSVGNYHLTQITGCGYGLEQISDENGASRHVSPRATASALYDLLDMYLKGIEEGKANV